VLEVERPAVLATDRAALGLPAAADSVIVARGVRPASEEVSQPVMAHLVREAEAVLRPVQFRTGVPPPSPHRGRFGQPRGTDGGHNRYHDADQAGSELALNDADPGHGQIECDRDQVKPDASGS
jgi:hypothetical protein